MTVAQVPAGYVLKCVEVILFSAFTIHLKYASNTFSGNYLWELKLYNYLRFYAIGYNRNVTDRS